MVARVKLVGVKRVCGVSLGVALCVGVTACGGGHGSRQHATTRAAAVPLAGGQTSSCPVTLPNGSTPPGERASPLGHGNGGLWTAFPADGRIIAAPLFVLADGSMQIKFPWWGSQQADGRLTITGSRLDRKDQRLRVSIAPGQTSAPHFWASGLTFPTEGCWRISAVAGNAHLTFVLFVTKQPFA